MAEHGHGHHGEVIWTVKTKHVLPRLKLCPRAQSPSTAENIYARLCVFNMSNFEVKRVLLSAVSVLAITQSHGPIIVQYGNRSSPHQIFLFVIFQHKR